MKGNFYEMIILWNDILWYDILWNEIYEMKFLWDDTLWNENFMKWYFTVSLKSFDNIFISKVCKEFLLILFDISYIFLMQDNLYHSYLWH